MIPPESLNSLYRGKGITVSDSINQTAKQAITNPFRCLNFAHLLKSECPSSFGSASVRFIDLSYSHMLCPKSKDTRTALCPTCARHNSEI